MPYIKKENRKKFEPVIAEIKKVFDLGITVGELNYLIIKTCIEYLKHKELNYTTLNDILGVINAVNQEFYRVKVTRYEFKKIIENGDLDW